MSVFKHVIHNVDFCVIGGGMPGLTAAIAAARRGVKVVIMQDRPVFGGNASSECRVHICGADRHNNVRNVRETGILEELRMENLYRNPNRNFSIWDTILYEAVMSEPNILPLLNCTCHDVQMDGNTIKSVTGWQLTTQTYHTVTANVFADCSGDAILAPLTGADFRIGREGQDEYGEALAPLQADGKTMGMTILFQTREYETPQPYEPPAWVHAYDDCGQLPYGAHGHRWWEMGYWWVEMGGEHNSIEDTELLRDELLKIALGVWDHIKNRCPQRDAAQNWALDWIQFMPAKRESRRYGGAHILTQNDIESGGVFEDVVAYGGWTMDDHHPAGFHAVKVAAPATHFHPCPSPYGIPFRSLVSRNISNLLFAGRDASCTHIAMSSTRVMGTGCTMGQAVGTAVALAKEKGIITSEMTSHITDLQQTLLYDDAYLPGIVQIFPTITAQARLEASTGDPELVRDGINRPVGDATHAWHCKPGDWIGYLFTEAEVVQTVTVIVDSGLDQTVAMSYHQRDNQLTSPPNVMPKAFCIEIMVDGQWKVLAHPERNYQRLCRFECKREIGGVRFVLESTWGAAESRVYAFYVE